MDEEEALILKKISIGRLIFVFFRSMTLRSIFWFCIFIRYLLLVFAGKFVLGYLCSLIDNPKAYFFVPIVLMLDREFVALIGQLVPTKFFGYDFARVLLIGIFLLVQMPVGRVASIVREYKNNLKFRDTFKKWKKNRKIEPEEDQTSPVSRKDFKKRKKAKIKNAKNRRVELLKILGDVQRDLDSMKRKVTFLSVDIVDSTGMKEGEEAQAIELDFFEYKGFVEKVLNDNKCMKSTWTPDGVMCCFKTANDSMLASHRIIRDLKTFNKTKKTIKRDFNVRCGVNTGVVSYDENTPIEEMVDRVIDIAGHFQKYAPQGKIYITKAAHDDIFDKGRFELVDKIIDDNEVYVSK